MSVIQYHLFRDLKFGLLCPSSEPIRWDPLSESGKLGVDKDFCFILFYFCHYVREGSGVIKHWGFTLFIFWYDILDYHILSINIWKEFKIFIKCGPILNFVLYNLCIFQNNKLWCYNWLLGSYYLSTGSVSIDHL